MENKIHKSEEISTINNRIKLLIAYLKQTQKAFASSISIGEGRLSNIIGGRNNPDSEVLANIINKYRFVNTLWLILGEGKMILPIETDSLNKKQIESDPMLEHYDLKPIPLVNTYAVGGFGSESFSIEQKDIKEYYVIPKFKYKKIDFMIEVAGESMSPRYNNGDIVACTVLKEANFIQWNKIHVIATKEQGIILKRILPSTIKNCFSIVADNPCYPSFDIPREEITGLALVAGGVKLE